MNAMINLKASRKTPTINVGVNPVTNVHVTNRGVSEPTTVHYPPAMEQPNGEFVSVSPQTAMSTFTNDIGALQSDDPEKG